MVARTKRPQSPHDILKMHVDLSKEREDLLERTQALQAAGKIREAREAFKAAEQVHKRIEQFEHRYRRRDPHASPDD
jgi:hypothetical protein